MKNQKISCLITFEWPIPVKIFDFFKLYSRAQVITIAQYINLFFKNYLINILFVKSFIWIIFISIPIIDFHVYQTTE